MTENTALTTGWSETSAREWVVSDGGNERFLYPWKMTAILVSLDDKIRNVLDAASGPGGYLKAVLEEIPEANGVWFDFSETMLGAAQENLAEFSDRVRFTTGDLIDLSGAGPAESFDLVTTSRATHHLLISDLGKFYASAASRLRSGGWIANIDTFNPGPEWRAQLRRLSRKLAGRENEPDAPSNHPHINTPATLEEHLACLRAAGFGQAEVPWKSFASGLLVAQKI